MSFLNFYITFKNKEEAENIWNILLEEKLIACYNIFPIESGFFWEEKKEKGKEYAWFFKTSIKNKKVLGKRIEKLHSYKTPCIMRFKVKANKSYEDWIKNSTK